MITEVEQKGIDALQKLHELIQMNSSESVGYCWSEFLRAFARRCGRDLSDETFNSNLRGALQSNDFDVEDFFS